MAISQEETKLRDETRVALLNAIKTDTELAIKSMERGSFFSGETLLRLAEAYGLLTGPSGVPKPAGRAMVG